MPKTQKIQKAQNVHYGTKEVAALFSVNVSTIKRWIDKGYIVAEKTPGGHRRIVKKDLLTFIKKYPQYTKNSSVLKKLEETKKTYEHNSEHAWKTYYQYLQSSEPEKGFEYLQSIYRAHVTIPVIIDTLLIPTYKKAEEDFEEKKITLYAHRKILLLLRQHMIEIEKFFDLSLHAEQKEKTAVLACVRKEYNEIYLEFPALYLKSIGWKVHVLGMNIQNSVLKKTIDDIQPQLTIVHHSKPSHFIYGCFLGISKKVREKKSILFCTGNGWNGILRKKSDPKKSIYFMESIKEMEKVLSRTNS